MILPTDAARITWRKFCGTFSTDDPRATVVPPAAALMRLSWDRCVLWIVEFLSRPLAPRKRMPRLSLPGQATSKADPGATDGGPPPPRCPALRRQAPLLHS